MKQNKFIKFIRQPYPFFYEGKLLAVITGAIFLLTFLLLYFFTPFDLNNGVYKQSILGVCFIQSFVSVVVFVPLVWVTRKIIKVDENWNVQGEMSFLLSVFLIIGISKFLIRDLVYVNPNNWSWRYLFEEVRNTFLAGLFIVLIIVPLIFNRLLYLNLKKANALNDNNKQDIAKIYQPEIFIETQVKDEAFYLDISKFLFAKADGNYSEIHIISEGKIKKLLKRISIKDILLKMEPYKYIIKTHRAYLVNLTKVANVSGNAQGYKLRIEEYQNLIPVSRQMIPIFEDKMKKLHS